MSIEVWVPILTTIIGAIATLLAVRYKHRLDIRKLEKKCPVELAVGKDTELMSKTEDLLALSGADRVCIYQFHNGGEYYTGRSMQKLSMTYETVKAGISHLQINRQNIPVSACNATLAPMITDRRLLINDVEKEMEDSLCKFYAMEAGTKSVYKWTVYDLQKRAIGFVQVDYVTRKKKLNEEILQDLEMAAIKIAGYL